ncbi:MAG: hypothetical protein L3J65_01435 [Robiginitomaculum sp.]|nr:hypothetical protein [Robiginitomaculum sp.]
MSKSLLRIFTMTALASAVSFTALAGNPFAEKADTNKDGLIQLSEFTALGNQKFTEMDTDANGLVTKEERRAFRELKREARAMKKFAKTDSNDDGFVSETEFMAAHADRKNSMQKWRDMNHDGQISKEDRQARKKMRKAKRKEMRQNKAKRPKMDTNGDGAIDLAEHQAATIAKFERMDKNADGVLGADEQRRPRTGHGKYGMGR